MLRPKSMVRLEVITPIERTGDVVRTLGENEITNFIDIPNVKREKYESITENVSRFEREEFLSQLHNRITNISKRFEIPYPRPIPLRKEIEKVLQEIDKKISSLELDYAKVENVLTGLNEERSSIERQIQQLYDEHESTKKFLSENKVDTYSIQKISKESFKIKNTLKDLLGELQNIQRILSLADASKKLKTIYGIIPNDESEIETAYQDIKIALLLNQQLQSATSETVKDIEKLRGILLEIREIVERKQEAIEKLKKLDESIIKTKNYIEYFNENLTEGILRLIGGSFQWQIKETLKILEELHTIKLDSPLDRIIQKFGSIISELTRAVGVLEASENFRNLDYTKAVIEKIRKGNIEEIKSAIEESKSLFSSLQNTDLKIIQKAFEIQFMEHRLVELAREPESLKKKVKELAQTSDFIHAYREVVEIELALENVFKRLRKTEKTCIFEAWVNKEDIDITKRVIKNNCPMAIINVAKKERGDKPPTIIKNPKLAMPYQKLLVAYGLPNYRELDPTIIQVFTFPILFGLMFGDMGHGLILLIGGIFLNQIWDKLKLRGEMWDWVREGRPLIIACGLVATVFGFLYGELFGPTTYHFAHLQGHGWPMWYTQLTGLQTAPWFGLLEDPSRNLMYFFKISIVIGIIHIFSGIIIDVYNKISVREFKEAALPFSWLWFYGGLSYIFLLIMTPQITPADAILNFQLLAIFFFIPLIGMIVIHKIVVGDFLEAFSEALTKAIESISNTFSYARLLALGATHAIFSQIALMGSGGNPLMFIGLFVIITLFMIIALEGILTFAHSLRLHWVEWYSKFYKGDGIPFESFTIKRRFTFVK